MKGETYAWCKLALRQGKSLDECRSTTTFRQLRNIWLPFFDAEINEFDKHDYYLAQIAQEVRASNQRIKLSVWPDIKKFILKFVSEKQTELTPEERMERSKRFWGFHIKTKQQKKKPEIKE